MITTTLFLFGGVAELDEKEPPSPKAEFWMAIMGPILSVALGLGFRALAVWGDATAWPIPLVGVIAYLGAINLILAGFNLIPAFPLDGGRVLRAILWSRKKDVFWATKISSRLGSFFGWFLIVIGAIGMLRGNFIGGMWWILIGLFLKDAAYLSFENLLVQDLLKGVPIRRFMSENPVVLSPFDSIQQWVDTYVSTHHKLFPVLENSRLIGCVFIEDLRKIPKADWSHRSVREILRPCSAENTVDATMDARKILTVLRDKSRLMVTEGDRLVGIVSLKDVLKYISAKKEIDAYIKEAA
ncbi:MAG: CBS domain-containing protein [Deltaproteobacteria bacterium]|nr:CBS domain-containing protein [Deltaproteobacteria bacterium]